MNGLAGIRRNYRLPLHLALHSLTNLWKDATSVAQADHRTGSLNILISRRFTVSWLDPISG